MIEIIEKAVFRYPDLTVKENKGEHHRVMKAGRHGSLWIVKTGKLGYRVETTGSVGTVLNSEIRILLGRDNDRETVKGYKVWYVDGIADVEKIIALYGRK